jgi:hypothetical protein
MMWGFYGWPCIGLSLGDRRRALVGRLRDLAEPVLRVPRWLSDARNAVMTASALLVELFRSDR